MEDENDKSIKVNDRRRFTSEGVSKDDSSVSDAKEEKGEKKEVKMESTEETKADAAQPIDFSSFVVSFATQALVLMGEIPHPETGEKVKNLDAAKQTVDILGILETKTAGNLTELEQKLLDDVLASVRLAFVNASNK